MDNVSLHRLADFLRAGARSIGIDPADVAVGRGAVVIEGTGISVSRVEGAPGRASGSWEIRETYDATDLLGGGSRVVSKAIASVAPGDLYGAARTALLAAAERGVEAALDEAAGR